MKEWFQNKTISLVGNAQSLVSTSYGKDIDSADVVCRINRGMLTASLHSSSHGKRTDVLFVNLMRTAKNFVINKKYKVISISPGSDGYGLVDFFYPTEYCKLLMGKVPTPTTGLRALDYLSKCEPKEIIVYGFDWKKTPTIAGNKIISNKGLHDYKLEKKYCFDNFFNLDNIKHII